jgi:hypothetical protein
MGYCVSISIGGVFIPTKNIDKCLEAINKLNQSYNSPPADDILNAFDDWSHPVSLDGEGITVDEFNGEKWRDQDEFYKVIAPFVEPKASEFNKEREGVIECLGEDGEKWRYIFKDGKIKHETAVVSWE